jgi:hypothetical protein
MAQYSNLEGSNPMKRKQYGWGVRGWGASQNNPMSALIKSSSVYLSADKADGISPGINSPLTNPWTDLKGDADCTLVNFAGTTADGWTVETINGKTNTFLNLDGLNSFGQFANMDVLNPVGSDDFCQMVVFRPDDTTARYYGVVRNESTGGDVQQGLLCPGGSLTLARINGVDFIVSSFLLNLQYVMFGRIKGRVFIIINGSELLDVAYANSIISKPNTQLGCRSNSVDGLTKAAFGKGLQGDIAFWKGPQGTLDKDKIVDLVKRAMKQKYGLGV